jgi:hypothetical protein
MVLLYLPAYSPDYNPIEEGFSAMKAWIRRNRDFANEMLGQHATADPIAMLCTAVHEAMMPQSIIGWFRDCGHNV